MTTTTLPDQFPSPDISTADILNASSIGWSPQRSPTKASFPQFADQHQMDEDADADVPTSPSRTAFDPETLRNRAYVSNSIFKNQTPDTKTQQAPFSGAGSRSGATQQRMGVGLGIGVDAARNAGKFTPTRKVNTEDDPTSPRACHPSAVAPRQTRGFEALVKSNYVSNSPFKQGVSESDSANMSSTRPLSFSTSPSKAQNRAAAQQPTTPTSQRIQMQDMTPQGSRSQQTPTQQSEDGKRGLLVSNRMRGPRTLDSPSKGAAVSGSDNERRRTVTFDEEPDIQEFDRDSSFDGSLRSSGTEQSMRNNALVSGPLVAMNASPSSSSPEFSDSDARHGGSGSSNSSSASPELSEVGAASNEDPHSSMCQQSAAMGSTNSLGGLQRVDSLVDELLHDEILSSKTPVQNKRLSLHESSIYGVDDSYEMPVRRGVANAKPAEKSNPFVPNSQAPRILPAGGLPSLPNWSPLMMDDKALFSEPQPSPSRVPASPRKPGGRPHISRDAVLERVAKEKKAQVDAQTIQEKPSLPSSNTLSDVSGKAATTGMRPAQSMEMPAARPPLVTKTSLETRREPEPRAFAKQQRVASVSPLDRLGEQMAKDVLKQDVQTSTAVKKPTEDAEWFASPGTSANKEGVPAKPAEATKLPGSSEDLQCPPSPTGSVRSGRLQPSTLGPAPPPVSQDEHADKIISRRQSKQRLGRRSLSFDAASPILEKPQTEMLFTQSTPGGPSSSSAHLSTGLSRQDMKAELHKSKEMLDGALKKAVDNGFESGMTRDISRIFREGDLPYKISDRGVFAGVNDKISHSKHAGDVDSGKAWKRIRRPSDLNEHAEEMKAYHAKENPKKASGRVFVLVDSFHPANLPVPHANKTQFFCILDNGLHVVKTGLSTLKPGQGIVSPIGQEFELIQHKNLEFSLTLFAQRDTHLQEKAGPSTPSKKEKHGSVTKSFMSKLLRSPKKDKSTQDKGDPMLSYMNREGAFGRVNLVFETIASKCLGKCLTVDLPVKGVAEPTSSISGQSTISSVRSADFSRNLSQSRGILRLKVFYLPPMPSVPAKLLPENLKECVTGIEQARWHQAESRLMGTLTQSGGDCSTWRRRPVKANGSSLVCYNEVTKKPVVKIDLSKAVKIQEAWDPCDLELSQTKGRDGSRSALVTKYNINEEPDESYHVARSFRIVFADEEKIYFFADTDKEKEQWLEVIADMIHSKPPPNPVWARMCLDAIKSLDTAKEAAKKPATTNASASTKPPVVPKEKGIVKPAPTSNSVLQTSPSKKAALNGKTMPTVSEETSTAKTPGLRKPLSQTSLNGKKATTTQTRKPSTSAGVVPPRKDQSSLAKRPATASGTAAASRIPVKTTASNTSIHKPTAPSTSAAAPSLPPVAKSTPFTPVRRSSVAVD